MATTRLADQISSREAEQRAIPGSPADSIRLDWMIAILACINVFGLFIDGWAHNHGRVDNTFFTPWHAVLYSAIGLAGLLLIVIHFRNVGRGYRWRAALPAGYGLALAGFFAFAAGGVGDLVWHETFGFEESLEALLSPTHLFLAATGSMIIIAPIRAYWNRETAQDWRSLLPVILSCICITSVFTFFTTFAAVTSELNSLTGPRPTSHLMIDIYGILSFVVHSNILLAVALFMSRRWRLPFGTLTLLFGVNALLMTWLHIGETGEFLFVLSAAAAGLLGDYLLQRDLLSETSGLRLFSCVMPFAYSLAALAAVHVLGTSVWGTGGLWWEIHMWLGVPVLAGAFGYGLSLLMQAPAVASKPAKS